MRNPPYLKVFASLFVATILSFSVLSLPVLVVSGQTDSASATSFAEAMPQSSSSLGSGQAPAIGDAPSLSGSAAAQPDGPSEAPDSMALSAAPSAATSPESLAESTQSLPGSTPQNSAEAGLAPLFLQPTAGPVTDFLQLVDDTVVKYGPNTGDLQDVPDALDKDSSLWVTYQLKDIYKADLVNLSASAYEVAAPTYLKKISGSLSSVEVRADDVGLVGTVSFSAGKTEFTFALDNLNAADPNVFPIQGLYFRFGVRLDMDEVAGRQNIHLNVDKNTTISVSVKDNQPKDAQIKSKTSIYNPATGTVDWTVTLDPEIARFVSAGNPADPDDGALAYTPYLFEDELGPNQRYKTGSFTIDGATPDPAAGLVYDEPTHTLSCTLVSGLPAASILKYSTLPENGLLYTFDAASGRYTMNSPGAGGLSVNNKAMLRHSAGSPTVSEKSANGSFAVSPWLTKTGVSTDFLNRTITWQLTLNTNGCTFKQIEVYDHLPDGLDFTGAIDITVTDAGGNAQAFTYGGAFTGRGTLGDYASAQLLLTLTAPNPTVYTIQYKTRFPASVLDTATTRYENQAWLRYNWEIVLGDAPVDVGLPTINGDHRVNASYIAKTATYDTKTHTISWKLEINRNRNAVPNLTVADWVDYNPATGEEAKQELLFNTITLTEVNGAPPAPAVSMQKIQDPTNAKKFSLSFTGLADTDCLVVEYKTKATDPAFYANNASTNFYNQASVQSGPAGPPLQTVTASPRFESKVLEKNSTGYRYDTHAIGWEVKVNKNELDYLPSTVITDVLPAHLRLEETSLRLDGTVTLGTDPVAGGGNYYTLTDGANGSQTLTVYLQDALDTASAPPNEIPYVNKQHSLRYDTILDVNNTPGFSFVENNGEKFTASNTAGLQSDLHGPVKVSAQREIQNQSFDKTSQLDKAGLKIHYSIAINQAMADMGSGPFVVEDTLPQGVLLDVPSVKVWPATVNGSGVLAKQGNTPKNDVALEVKANQMRLDLKLNTPAQRSQAWLITYSVDIVDGAGSYSLTNQAGLGFTGSQIGSSDEISFSLSAAEAGAANNTRRNLEVTRLDDGTKTPLPGAVFELYAFYPGTANRYLVASATTGADGKAIFKGLKVGLQYLLIEARPPSGYPRVPEQALTVQPGGASQTLEVEVASAPTPDSPSSSGPSSISSSLPASAGGSSLSPPSPSSSALPPADSGPSGPGSTPKSQGAQSSEAAATGSGGQSGGPASPQTADAHTTLPLFLLLLGSGGLLCAAFVLRAKTSGNKTTQNK